MPSVTNSTLCFVQYLAPVLFLLVIGSCQTTTGNIKPDISHTIDSIPKDSLKPVKPEIKKSITHNALQEYRAFEKKYESKWTEKPAKFPYSNIGKIKIFSLSCPGECHYEVFYNRVSEGVEISKAEFDELMNILSSPASYGNSVAACFGPSFGLVLYDDENIPTEYLSICLDCNRYRTFPGTVEVKLKNEILFGFSKDTRRKLRNLIIKWGIDYYGYSEFWDDEKEYENYLKKKK
jgi:hypothetical protein